MAAVSVLIRVEANLRFQHLQVQTDSEAANRRARVRPLVLTWSTL